MNKIARKSKRNENLLKNRFTLGEPELRNTSQIRIAKTIEKAVRNRCCYVRPKQSDFGQITEHTILDYLDGFVPLPKELSYTVAEQNIFNPILQDSQLQELKNALYSYIPRAHICTQYNNEVPNLLMNCNELGLQEVDSIQYIEEAIEHSARDSTLKNVHISETPKVKVIAEKFCKFKRNNVELRRLDEKVVCVEYDVFNQESINHPFKPNQTMRAFFSVKPRFKNDVEEPGEKFPTKVKQEFKVLDEDLLKLTEKEIEVVDDKIEENKSYLDDLRCVLKRKRSIDDKHKQSSIDLKSLYKMARRASCYSDVSVVNFLSKAELEKVKDMILEQCKSSVHGITRRKLQSEMDSKQNMANSGSMLAELMRENGKVNVFK